MKNYEGEMFGSSYRHLVIEGASKSGIFKLHTRTELMRGNYLILTLSMNL